MVKEKKVYVRCARCRVYDQTRTEPSGRKIGTRTTMRCPDCCQGRPDQLAQLCRDCCPTEHRTKLVEDA